MAETEKLSENNPGELGDVVKMRDEFENKKGRGEAQEAGAKNLNSSKQDYSSFAEVDVAETEELAEHNLGELKEGLGDTEQRVGVGMLSWLIFLS